jgi:serine/threonine-protein kinase BUR1
MQLSSPSAASSQHRHHHSFRGASPVSNYEMMEKLGEGTFGYGPSASSCGNLTTNSEVWKARGIHTKELFALKKILMHNEKEGVHAISLGLNANNSSR